MSRLFVLLFVVFCAVQAGAVTLKGRVVLGGAPVPGASVRIFDAANDSVELKRTTTDAEGYYAADIAAGLYMVLAEKTISRRVYRGASGKNPVRLDSDVYAGIKLTPHRPLTVRHDRNLRSGAVMSATLSASDGPVQGARLYLYLDPKDMKGMPYLFSAPAGADGIVTIGDIVDGRYYVVAKKRRDGAALGPVGEGDLIGFSGDNPVTVRGGRRYRLTVSLFEKQQDEQPPLVAEEARVLLSGTAVDIDGMPVAGVYGFAYKNKEMGHERPVSVSAVTGIDGKFSLVLPGGGRYYVGIREHYGGTPVQGERYGLYDGSYDHHIDVDKDVDGVVIKVKKILR